MDYTGRVAFVTGVSHGIGRAIALGLAKGGASLALADLQEQGLRETEALAREAGAEVISFVLDVRDNGAVCRAVTDAVARFGKIDILVNNAGIYNTFHPFAESTPEEWKQKIDVNVYGTLYPIRAILPGMLERGYGRIVNIGSVAGVYGIPNMADYSMTKGAVIALTHALAKEVAAQGVTVNCVSPGSINVHGEKGEHDMPEHSFTGRAGTPEECASIVLFLATESASYISGQNYQVDGCRKKM